MFIKNILPLFIMVLFVFCGCGSDGTSAGEAAPAQSTAATPAPGAATTTPPATPPTPEPAQNADGVWHYTCPNGCEGGGGSAVACAGCGTTLAHNPVYHGNPAAPATPAGATTTSSATPAGLTPSVMLNDPSKGGQLGGQAATTVTPTKAPEPPQNAAGVWHYTCPSGCAGGGGSAIACSGCGTTLVHNTAYHQ